MTTYTFTGADGHVTPSLTARQAMNHLLEHGGGGHEIRPVGDARPPAMWTLHVASRGGELEPSVISSLKADRAAAVEEIAVKVIKGRAWEKDGVTCREEE